MKYFVRGDDAGAVGLVEGLILLYSVERVWKYTASLLRIC